MELQNNTDPKLRELVQKLSYEFPPVKIFLFGSRAQNKAHTQSDYDLVYVIAESNLPRRQRQQKAREILWGKSVPVDIFIYTLAEFEELKNEFSTIPYTAFHEGLELSFV